MKKIAFLFILLFAGIAAAHAQTDTIRKDSMKPKQETVFTFAEQMPEFPGGEGALNKYLQEHIVFPEAERKAGKQGTVFISFIVEKDGSISNVQAVKEVVGAPGFTQEAIRVFSGMPKWEPAKMNGRPVRSEMTVPVKFKL